jgi:hypothetical protein
MLTPTDVHYLVGLLTRSSSPDDVEIELGSTVYDKASDESRDVDVTVTRKTDDNQIDAYCGIEVKKHTRPLDSTHVEQLCCKLNDMPRLTTKSIVSASGYSSPAVKKAEAHGVRLYELKPWVDTTQGFDHLKSHIVPSVARSLDWFGNVAVRLNPNNRIKETDREFFSSNPPVYFGDGRVEPECPDLKTLINKMRYVGQSQVMKVWNPPTVIADEAKPVKVSVRISDHPYANAPSGKVIIEEFQFEGSVVWKEATQHTECKVLTLHGDEVTPNYVPT